MRWSIRYQLLVPLLVLLLGLAGVSTWTGMASAHRAWQQLETQMRNVARTLSEASFPLNQWTLEHMKGLSGAEYVLLTGTSRTVTFPADRMELPLPETIGEDWQPLPAVEVAGQTYLCSGVRLQQGRATLYILYPERLWRDALWEAIQPSLVLGVFGGVVALALTLGVAQRLGRRILELERRTRLIAAGDFSPMPLPRRNDELRDLSRSVNEMARQLAQLQETMQKTERLRLLGQVSGGLAHQLRNGVAGARLAVQLHSRECNGAADREPLEVALRQLTLVEANLKRFLDLGRTEGLRREPCSLKEVLDEAVSLLRPRCRHTGIELRWAPPAGRFRVQGDAGRLGHLLLNVIGNAVEAAGPGGWVEIGLSRQPAAGTRAGGAAVIEVFDSGPGPTAEVATRLFEPFVTGKPDGVGLGLAVARQVAEAHGGQIGWHRLEDRTCFRVELPLEDES